DHDRRHARARLRPRGRQRRDLHGQGRDRRARHARADSRLAPAPAHPRFYRGRSEVIFEPIKERPMLRLTLAGALLAATTLAAQAQALPERITTAGKIVVATQPNYPPIA